MEQAFFYLCCVYYLYYRPQSAGVLLLYKRSRFTRQRWNKYSVLEEGTHFERK